MLGQVKTNILFTYLFICYNKMYRDRKIWWKEINLQNLRAIYLLVAELLNALCMTRRKTAYFRGILGGDLKLYQTVSSIKRSDFRN